MRKKKKKHFQLLEILIAMLLIVLCAIPIIQAYTEMSRVQFEDAKSSQRDYLAHQIHAAIIEKLYQNSISWHDLTRGRQDKLERLEGMEDVVDALRKLSYEGLYQLNLVKRIKQKDIYKYLLDLTITMYETGDKKLESKNVIAYHYQVFLKSENKHEIGSYNEDEADQEQDDND